VADRLPPSPINTLPIGLLDLLGIKSGGEYPRDLSQQLGSSIELLDFYLNARAENLSSGGFTVAATGFQTVAAFAVPANELWWVHRYSLRYVTGAAEAISAEPMWMFDVLGTQTIQILNSPTTLGATANGSSFMASPPLLAPPNSQAAYVVNSITGVIDLAAYLRITRFRI
jgi:hypothetical protein